MRNITDSKPCVQAIDKLCRGEFSASPRVTSFISIVARYQVTVRHLAGSSNFISRLEQSVVTYVSVEEITTGGIRLPFTSRSAWLSTQSECRDLRRVIAHLKQSIRPSKKLTNVRYVKRYLSSTSLARDGLIVVRHDMPFAPSRELIVVPRQVLDGLLTALHLKLSHPTKHQLKLVVRRNFYALDLDSAIKRVADTCHTCMSLLKLPQTLIEQSTTHLPDAIGFSFAADVIKRSRQLIFACIFVIGETVSSYTSTCIVESERHEALRDCIVRLCVEFRPLDGPPAVIRVDPAPGFIALVENPTLQRLGIRLEVGRVNNPNN